MGSMFHWTYVPGMSCKSYDFWNASLMIKIQKIKKDQSNCMMCSEQAMAIGNSIAVSSYTQKIKSNI